jgi:hypothetical protein
MTKRREKIGADGAATFSTTGSFQDPVLMPSTFNNVAIQLVQHQVLMGGETRQRRLFP